MNNCMSSRMNMRILHEKAKQRFLVEIVCVEYAALERKQGDLLSRVQSRVPTNENP